MDIDIREEDFEDIPDIDVDSDDCDTDTKPEVNKTEIIKKLLNLPVI